MHQYAAIGPVDRSVKREGSRTRVLDSDQMAAFRAELDAIREEVVRDLGDRDAQHIRRIVSLQRYAELGGRTLLFAGLFPPAWIAGVGLLSLSKILAVMEIGHNVLHGQYDWMNDPALSGGRYAWDLACPEEQWRHYHNHLHHVFTNVVGKDRDVGYGLLRMAEEQAWNPLTALQPAYAFGLMLAFEWGLSLHDLELDRVLTGKKPWTDLIPLSKALAFKATRQKGKDYVLFPLLAGVCAPLVFAGNLSANLARNVWAFLIIFCGHFPDGVRMYLPEEVLGETRGTWYQRQIGGSANIEGGPWFHVLSGHLSHQIEHHLFPDLPAHRYPEIAAQVQAVCRKYGIAYNTGPFRRQVSSAMLRIFRYAVPPRMAEALRGLPRAMRSTEKGRRERETRIAAR